MKTISLAFRNLSRQKKRSFLLAGAVAFGFFIVTLIDCLAAGAIQNLEEQFSYLFGGDVMVIRGFDTDNEGSGIEDEKMIMSVLDESGIPYKYVNKRVLSSGNVVFEGKKAMMNVFGCDFDKEAYLKDSLILAEGSWEAAKDPHGIILGEGLMKSLKLVLGDEIILQLQTASGQANFGEFTVVAVSKDISIIGTIASYAHYEYLNELSGLADNDFNTITIMLDNKKIQDQAANIIESGMRAHCPQVTNRMEAIKVNPMAVTQGIARQVKDADWKGVHYEVYSMNDQMPQLNQLTGIVSGVCYVILIAVFFIVMIGIANTYRMVLYERIREIGTMRAIGMNKKDAGRIFAWESILLTLLGAIVGLIFALICMFVLSLFTFNSETMSVFLHNGHWTYIVAPFGVIIKLIIVVVLTLIAVSGSVRKVSRMNPAEALRTVK